MIKKVDEIRWWYVGVQWPRVNDCIASRWLFSRPKLWHIMSTWQRTWMLLLTLISPPVLCSNAVDYQNLWMCLGESYLSNPILYIFCAYITRHMYLLAILYYLLFAGDLIHNHKSESLTIPRYSLGAIYSLETIYYTTVTCQLLIPGNELCTVFFVIPWLRLSLPRPGA